jgi:hypothetical protein
MAKMKQMMAVAWHSGRQAAESDYQRVVPDHWEPYADEWKAGYDNKPIPETAMLKKLSEEG